MQGLPSGASASGVRFTVADFLEAGRRELSLELVAGGENLSHAVEDSCVSRTGLALTGFFEHFAWQRLQLVGNAECAYLDSLSAAERRRRIEALLAHGVYCVIFTCSHRPAADEVRLAERSKTVLLTTALTTSDFAHRSAFVLERLGAPRATVYGTMVEVCGIGVLFRGDPGLGKSETALGLIKRGHALVADDLTCLRKEQGHSLLFGSASAATAGYMEIRGLGIMHIPSIFGVNAVRGEKRLQLVITFKRLDDVRSEIDRIGQTRHTCELLGVEVPHVVIPVSAGRDLVNLVETAAQQHKLYLSGADPVGALSEHLRRRADAVNRQEGNMK